VTQPTPLPDLTPWAPLPFYRPAGATLTEARHQQIALAYLNDDLLRLSKGKTSNDRVDASTLNAVIPRVNYQQRLTHVCLVAEGNASGNDSRITIDTARQIVARSGITDQFLIAQHLMLMVNTRQADGLSFDGKLTSSHELIRAGQRAEAQLSQTLGVSLENSGPGYLERRMAAPLISQSSEGASPEAERRDAHAHAIKVACNSLDYDLNSIYRDPGRTIGLDRELVRRANGEKESLRMATQYILISPADDLGRGITDLSHQARVADTIEQILKENPNLAQLQKDRALTNTASLRSAGERAKYQIQAQPAVALTASADDPLARAARPGISHAVQPVQEPARTWPAAPSTNPFAAGTDGWRRANLNAQTATPATTNPFAAGTDGWRRANLNAQTATPATTNPFAVGSDGWQQANRHAQTAAAWIASAPAGPGGRGGLQPQSFGDAGRQPPPLNQPSAKGPSSTPGAAPAM